MKKSNHKNQITNNDQYSIPKMSAYVQNKWYAYRQFESAVISTVCLKKGKTSILLGEKVC